MSILVASTGDVTLLPLAERRKLADNPSTPPETLAMLAKDGDADVRWRVVHNPNTPPETLAMLAKDREEGVRWCVADNPSTPPETLVLLAKDREEGVRWRAAHNPSTPPDTLAMLAEDEDAGWYVAHNPSAPPDTLAMLAKDNDATVRWCVADNPSAPPDAMVLLAGDKSADVRRRAEDALREREDCDMRNIDLKKRIECGRAAALQAAPYAADAFAAIEVVITDKLPEITAACDKNWRVYFHPGVEWTMQELGWVWLHEVMGHLVREHCLSIGARDHNLANVAQDLEIESWEWSEYVKRPPDGLHPDQYDLPSGKLWTWYYDELLKSKDKIPDKNCGSGARGEAQPWELGERADMSETKRRVVVQKTAESIAAASERTPGNVPSSLAVWADAQLAPPKVDWRARLRSALASRLSAGCIDMLGPAKERRGGVLQPRWRAPRPQIGVIVDTSGSMCADAGDALRQVVDIVAAVGEASVAWTDCDDPHWQRLQPGSKLRPCGGGGTDLRPAIDAAKAKRFDELVIVTDCETPWPDKPCGLVVQVGSTSPPKGWRVIRI